MSAQGREMPLPGALLLRPHSPLTHPAPPPPPHTTRAPPRSYNFTKPLPDFFARQKAFAERLTMTYEERVDKYSN